MIRRSDRSFISTTLFQEMVRGSSPSPLVWLWMLLSITAARRLCAFSMAAKSPVKCRLMSSMGSTWEYPPPVAPPLIPNTGPREGSRSTTVVFFPRRFNPSESPMETVVFPSPAGVGEMADTRISLLWALLFWSISFRGIFALYFPNISISSASMPNFSAISVMGRSFTFLAMSRSFMSFLFYIKIATRAR